MLLVLGGEAAPAQHSTNDDFPPFTTRPVIAIVRKAVFVWHWRIDEAACGFLYCVSLLLSVGNVLGIPFSNSLLHSRSAGGLAACQSGNEQIVHGFLQSERLIRLAPL